MAASRVSVLVQRTTVKHTDSPAINNLAVVVTWKLLHPCRKASPPNERRFKR